MERETEEPDLQHVVGRAMPDRAHATAVVMRVDESREGELVVASEVGNATPVRPSQLVNGRSREDDIDVSEDLAPPRTGQGATSADDALRIR
jgi:hypothetical protein